MPRGQRHWDLSGLVAFAPALICVLGGSSPIRKLLVKHQPAKSVNPAARRFGIPLPPDPKSTVLVGGQDQS
jgi:hypothetical protein